MDRILSTLNTELSFLSVKNEIQRKKKGYKVVHNKLLKRNTCISDYCTFIYETA